MKAIVKYFLVVLFVMLYNLVLTFESVDEIRKSDHSNESYCAVLFCGAVYYAVWLFALFRLIQSLILLKRKEKVLASLVQVFLGKNLCSLFLYTQVYK